MTALAVLGGGRIGTALAAAWAEAGHEVVLGTRDPDSARDRWQGPAVGHTSRADAVTGAEVVVNALAGDDAAAKAVAAGLVEALGWRPEWLADVGGLAGARVLESFIDLVPALYARHRGAPFALAVAA